MVSAPVRPAAYMMKGMASHTSELRRLNSTEFLYFFLALEFALIFGCEDVRITHLLPGFGRLSDQHQCVGAGVCFEFEI